MTSLPIMRRVFGVLVASAACGLVVSCASPALSLYTLDPGPPGPQAATNAGTATIIEVRRASIPDYLDNEDILVRTGSNLARSPHGRMASRLSVGVTDFLAARLAASRPNALVTDQPQSEAPTFRLIINVSKLDIRSDGSGVLEADWLVVPASKNLPETRDRTQLQASGVVSTDQGVISLEQDLLGQLADNIERSIPQ